MQGPNFSITRVSLPIAPSKGPKLMFQLLVFLIRSFSTPQFPHRCIRGFQFPHCVNKGQRALNFPLRHQGPPFPHHVIKINNRDKRVQSQSRGVCEGGVKGIRLWSMRRGPGESPSSMGPERPRYATVFTCSQSHLMRVWHNAFKDIYII